jgi:hypothetical protein
MAPFRTKTKHNGKYLNPTPVSWVQDAPSVSPSNDDVYKLLPEVYSMMKMLEPMLDKVAHSEERKPVPSHLPALVSITIYMSLHVKLTSSSIFIYNSKA